MNHMVWVDARRFQFLQSCRLEPIWCVTSGEGEKKKETGVCGLRPRLPEAEERKQWTRFHATFSGIVFSQDICRQYPSCMRPVVPQNRRFNHRGEKGRPLTGGWRYMWLAIYEEA